MSSAISKTETETDLVREPLPAPLHRLVLFVAFAICSGVGLTNWLEASAQVTWTGTLRTVPQIVTSPIETRIHEIHFSAGQNVAQGEILLQLDPGSLDAEIAKQQKQIKHLELRLAQAEAQAEVELSWRIKELDEQIHVTNLKSAELLKEKYVAEIGNVAWSEFLTSGGDSSSLVATQIFPSLYTLPVPDEARIRAMLQQEAAHNAAEVYSTQVELCDRHLSGLNSLKSELPERVRKARGIPLIRAELDEAVTVEESLQNRLARVNLASPTYGTVGLFRKRTSDDVQVGEPIVEILDRRVQFIELVVPSRHLAMFSAGKEVTLRFPTGEKRHGLFDALPPQTKTTSDDGENLIALRIMPTDKTWPEVPFGTSVDIEVAK